MSPFDTCWHRVDRAELHRQALMKVWNDLNMDEIYRSTAYVSDDGTGQFFIRTIKRDWMLPFSLQFGEMLYQLRSGLDSCVYDAAILKSGQDPPPDKEKWEFVFGSDPDKFDHAMRRMKNIISNDVRGLIEAVQPYSGTTGIVDGVAWDIGRTLNILNDWARIDRHRRLHLAGTAVTHGHLGIHVPSESGMSIEYVDFNVADKILENNEEVARFKIANFVSGTNIHMQPQFIFEIMVDETPRVRLNEISLAIGNSVTIVRESFEKHFGIQRI